MPALFSVSLTPLWRYRSFILAMISGEFRNRYGGTLLGPLWALITPALLIATYLVVFSQVMRSRLPIAGDDTLAFGIFLCTGVIAWTLFTDVVTRCQGVFFENRSLIKKASFPRLALPAAVFLTVLVQGVLMFGLFLLGLALLGRLPGLGLLGLVPLVLILLGIALGLGVLLGTLTVFFRDLGPIVGAGLPLWFWITPIVYPRAILPDWAQGLVALNPLVPVFEAGQMLVLTGAVTDWPGLWPQAVLALALPALALVVFRHLAPAMVDEL